jgi:hypothetical protein
MQCVEAHRGSFLAVAERGAASETIGRLKAIAACGCGRQSLARAPARCYRYKEE